MYLFPGFEEVLIEHFLSCIIMVNHASIEDRHLFSILTELDSFAIVVELDIVRERLIIRGKARYFVFKILPFNTFSQIVIFPPKTMKIKETKMLNY
jgi:hypothetical protein